MIKSMTGFGRSEISDESYKFTVELKAVNHRYFDVNIKMPKKLSFFESSIRNLLKKYIQRGKVDVFISYEDFAEKNVSVKYHEEIAREYYQYLNQMADTFGIENDVKVSDLSAFPDIFTMEEQTENEEALWNLLEQALEEACVRFQESRITEGERLKEDLMGKCKEMLTFVDYIEERYPNIVKEYKEKLISKVNEFLKDSNMDEGRIAMEVTLLADKICVDEETVRLRSHIQSTMDTLSEEGNIGRKLDFIAQEMNREANTILSKANDLSISDTAINLKTDIEKVREQIQNIE